MKMPPKKTLFQYRPPQKWAFGNLRDHKWYCQTSLKFNDPYDCGIVPDVIEDVTVKQYNRYRKMYPEHNLSPPPPGAAIVPLDFTNPKAAWDRVRESTGVVCFSEQNDNLLMWSHYSDGGKGFCLQFNTENEEFEGDRICKVTYATDIPPVSAVKMWLSKDDKPFFKIMTRKPKDWKYEREWRFLCPKVGEMKYEPQILKAVYLGTEATRKTRARVSSIVKKVYPHAELWQGYLSKSKYKVDFDPINAAARAAHAAR